MVIGEEESEAQMMDISEHGMFIRTKSTLTKDARINIRFVLREGQELCTGQGTIAWCSDLGGGIDLTEVNAAFSRFIARLSLVAEYPRSKKEMLDGLLFPPELEINP